jgi:hypothetical protein
MRPPYPRSPTPSYSIRYDHSVTNSPARATAGAGTAAGCTAQSVAPAKRHARASEGLGNVATTFAADSLVSTTATVAAAAADLVAVSPSYGGPSEQGLRQATRHAAAHIGEAIDVTCKKE